MRNRYRDVAAALPAAVLLAAPAPAQTGPEPAWVRQFGTFALDFAFGAAPDGAGGVFLGGQTEGPLGGSWTGTSDVFLARYDGEGSRLWLRQFGTPQRDLAMTLAPDGSGGFFAAGYTFGSLAGPSAGVADVWLGRYGADGATLWERQFGTAAGEYAYAAAADGSGGVFVAGATEGALGGVHAGDRDGFVARYDGEGERLWVRQIGTPEREVIHGAAPDGVGGVYVVGWTRGDLGGENAGSSDAFVARWDSGGELLWVRQFGTRLHDVARGVAPDGEGGVIVTGSTGGSLGGPSAGGSDTFVARYGPGGDRLWISQFGTSGRDVAYTAAPDGSGGAYVAGFTEGDLGGPHAGGWTDAFVARFDRWGGRLWVSQFGTETVEEAMVLTPDGSGGVYAAGWSYGSLGGPSSGETDAFIARFPGSACYADCDGSGGLDFFDFLCFQNAFLASERYADCDGSGRLDFFDFLCFQNAFLAGCP